MGGWGIGVAMVWGRPYGVIGWGYGGLGGDWGRYGVWGQPYKVIGWGYGGRVAMGCGVGPMGCGVGPIRL